MHVRTLRTTIYSVNHIPSGVAYVRLHCNERRGSAFPGAKRVDVCRALATAVAVDMLGRFNAETALFFPDVEKKAWHKKLSGHPQVADVMPALTGESESTVHECVAQAIMLISCP